MAAGSVPRYCIKDSRCRLCQFALEDGEIVIAGIGEDHVSAAFSFVRYKMFEDEEEEIVVHMCGDSSCKRGDFRVHCFHYDCYSFRLFPITSTFLAATEYQFSPPIAEGSQRRRRIQHALATKLKFGFLKRLPEEICHMVAGSLVRECAIVNLQALAASTDSLISPSQTVDLSQDIYAQYIHIEGIRYIQALSNIPSIKVKGRVQVFKTQRGRVVRNIYIRYDHLGIRGIWFTRPKNALLHSLDTSGIWWTELSRKDGILQVTTNTDGLKLRYLQDSTPHKYDRPVSVPSWPRPGLACRIIDLETCRITRERISHLRMSFIDYNKPDIEGYSAAICGLHISKLYAHHSGIGTPCYRELDKVSSGMLWMYMPIDQDEYLRELWAIRHPGAGCVALMLLTNLERGVIFGPYLTHPKLQFHRIFATANHPSRLYFNEWDPDCDDTWIKFLGLDTNAKTDLSISYQDKNDYQNRFPHSLIPASPPPYTQYNELWYYTNCRMENVTEITCCVCRTAKDKPIIGVLLRYKNGRRSCLGQYRQDWALTPLQIDPASVLRIGMGKTVKGFPYVAKVSLQGLASPGSLRWIDIPWHGRLEWWFSPRQCTLRYYE